MKIKDVAEFEVDGVLYKTRKEATAKVEASLIIELRNIVDGEDEITEDENILIFLRTLVKYGITSEDKIMSFINKLN